MSYQGAEALRLQECRRRWTSTSCTGTLVRGHRGRGLDAPCTSECRYGFLSRGCVHVSVWYSSSHLLAVCAWRFQQRPLPHLRKVLPCVTGFQNSKILMLNLRLNVLLIPRQQRIVAIATQAYGMVYAYRCRYHHATCQHRALGTSMSNRRGLVLMMCRCLL
jgi:hypothetical protein